MKKIGNVEERSYESYSVVVWNRDMMKEKASMTWNKQGEKQAAPN